MPYQDRKSTRLNSSHTIISYAVFCLKKKKNTRADSTPHPSTPPHTHTTPPRPNTHPHTPTTPPPRPHTQPTTVHIYVLFFFNKTAPTDVSALSLRGDFRF